MECLGRPCGAHGRLGGALAGLDSRMTSEPAGIAEMEPQAVNAKVIRGV
jgi:hypothetical protein